jgi:hypothetical protein
VRARLSAWLLLAAIAACSDTSAPPTVYGTYDLQTVDAKPLPTLLYEEGDYTFAAQDAFYTLREDNTFLSSVTWLEEYQGWTHTSTHTFEGTFTVGGDTVTLVWPSDGREWTGMLQGGELTIEAYDHVWLFRK